MKATLCLLMALSSAEATPSHRLQDALRQEASLEPLLDSRTMFSKASLEDYLDVLRDYKDYIPEEIQMVFERLSESTKNEMVAAVNDIETGKIGIPNNAQEIFEFISKRMPQLGDNADNAMDTMVESLSELQTQTRSELRKWWDRFSEALSVPENRVANSLASVIADFYYTYDGANQIIKNDVRKVSPETSKLLESNFSKNFAYAAKKFADAGLTADIHQLNADADFPPKAPSVRINNDRRGDFKDNPSVD